MAKLGKLTEDCCLSYSTLVHTFFTPFRLKKFRCLKCLKVRYVVEETGEEIAPPTKMSGTGFVI